VQSAKAFSVECKTQLHEFGLQLDRSKADYMECGSQTDDTIAVDGEDAPIQAAVLCSTPKRASTQHR
jgi:hypothetical protein